MTPTIELYTATTLTPKDIERIINEYETATRYLEVSYNTNKDGTVTVIGTREARKH